MSWLSTKHKRIQSTYNVVLPQASILPPAHLSHLNSRSWIFASFPNRWHWREHVEIQRSTVDPPGTDMVDYSKFSKIEDSDEEPIWQSEVKTSKALSQQVLDELDSSAERLASRSRPCHCFFRLFSGPGEVEGLCPGDGRFWRKAARDALPGPSSHWVGSGSPCTEALWKLSVALHRGEGNRCWWPSTLLPGKDFRLHFAKVLCAGVHPKRILLLGFLFAGWEADSSTYFIWQAWIGCSWQSWSSYQ